MPEYRPRWSNCLFWALHQLHRDGGYVLIRKGHHGFPFHVLWSRDHREVWSYEPIAPLWRPKNWKFDLFVVYRGQVVQGDDWVVPQ